MVYVSISWSLTSDHRPSVQSVPLGLLCPESKAQGHLWLGRSREGDWCLLSILVVWLRRTCGWSCHWCCLWWRNWGLVSCPMSSGLWEGLSCSLLPLDSPSESLTGWARAHAPEICLVRAIGSQSTCLESCLGSLGPRTQLLASLEGLWTLWLSLGLSP